MSSSINIIRTLRDLVPRRPLTWSEAERVTELQANRLRELLDIGSAALPEEAISDLPRIEVRRSFELPVSGLTFWDNGKWVVVVNAAEPDGRQRFSLAHELAHVVNHTTKDFLCAPGYVSSEEKGERLADYFAACLLMPKRHVKRLFGEGRSLTHLASLFQVTPRATAVRLSQLGLTEQLPRCGRPTRGAPDPSVYHRALSMQGVAA